MKIVDTHQHLWDLQRFPYSWTSGIPALHRSFLIEEYVAESAGTGIEKTVFMECDVDDPLGLEEARYAQSLADANSLISGIVASGRPENEGFAAYLEKLRELSKVKGLRRVLHTQDDSVSTTKRFRDNLKLLPPYGYSFDLCVFSRQLPLAVELVQACSDVTFILDHCGVPDVKGGAMDPWKTWMRNIARCENVVACKVSGLVAYADPKSWNVNTLMPWFEHVVDCFGWDRLVWGGDWPVCTASATLSEWVDASLLLAKEASATEQGKLFHLNAERIYRV